MTTETETIQGSQATERIKQLVREGNVRRIRLLHKGRVVFDIPLTVGVPATLALIWMAPTLAAIGAAVFFFSESTLEVERVSKTDITTR